MENILNGMGGIQSLGIMNAVKTGDPRFDTLVALCLPFLLQYLLGLGKKVSKYLDIDYWKKWFFGQDMTYHERSISNSFTFDRYGDRTDLDDDSHNSVLIKAIRIYCHTHIDLKLQKADLSLTTLEGEADYAGGGSLVNRLQSYKLIKDPPAGTWHTLGIFGKEEIGKSMVQLMIDNDSDDSDDDKRKQRVNTVKYTLRSLDGNALDHFLDTVYGWYTLELEKKEDHSRYYYDLESKSLGTSPDDQKRTYKRYRLSDEKTFDSLFFREKASLLKLINDFMQKKGKYAVKGYPHKLGLLLTGPPGTGKTSLIKALAHYTGRNIVNVPLSKISTNEELMEHFFDTKYRVPGVIPVQLGFRDVIFVLEDLDAASDIVKRRDVETKDKTNYPVVPPFVTPDKSVVGDNSGKQTEHLGAPTIANGDNSGNQTEQFGAPSSWGRDSLNLSGLLNTLDGVVDCPERIVIMSTNYPEKLDKALIRPGRIDKKLYLGYMADLDVIAMLEHYFQSRMTPGQRKRVKEVIGGSDGRKVPLKMTPAQIEQMTVEHDAFGGMIGALEAMALPNSSAK